MINRLADGEHRSPYHPLGANEIRVLRLLPGDHQDALSATLQHASLSPHGEASIPFEAVSYAWGSGLKPYHILIDDLGAIPITESLEQLLRHFRYTNRPRDLWADAVCINQEDLDERSRQVTIMARVYAASTRVLIWLGLSQNAVMDERMEVVAKVCKELAEQEEFDEEEITIALISDRLKNDTIDGEMDVLNALSTMWSWIRRPWFTRLWVVQEAFSGRELRYCTNTFTWTIKQVTAILGALRDNWLPLQAKLGLSMSDKTLLNDVLEDITQISQSAPNAAAVLRMLIINNLRQCSDPSDRVFAIRNVLNVEHVEGLRPDYNIEPAHVYRTLIEHLLQQENAEWPYINAFLIIALASTTPRDGMKQLPSWTPNLHAFSMSSRAKMNAYEKYPFERHRCLDERPESLWEADYDYLINKIECSIGPQAGMLKVRGRVFAKVLEVVPLPSVPTFFKGNDITSDLLNYSSFEEFLDWFHSWYGFFRDFYEHSGSEHGFDIYRELVNFLAWPTHWTSEVDNLESVDKNRENSPPEFWEKYKTSRRTSCDGWSNRIRGSISFLVRALSGCPLIHNRRAWKIVTTNGRVDLAWLPTETQSGDGVCLFSGAIWPFVVHPIGDGTSRVVGDCHTYAVPLIEALGGVYDDSQHGDGHWTSWQWQESERLSSPSAEDVMEEDNSMESVGDLNDSEDPDEDLDDADEGDIEQGDGQIDQEDVQFVRGECLGANMPGLRYDDLIAKMDYIALV